MFIKFLQASNGDAILISFIDDEENHRNILIDGGLGKTYQYKNKKSKIEAGDLKSTIDLIRGKKQSIDLLIMTHIDDDHIGGIIEWFKSDQDAYKQIKQVWFNSGRLIAEGLSLKPNKDLDCYLNPNTTVLNSIPQGIEFGNYITEKGIWDKVLIKQDNSTIEKFGLKFRILSPNKSKLEKLLKDWKKVEPDLLTASLVDDYSISLKEHIKNDKFVEDDRVANGSSIAFILTFKDINYLFLGDAHPSVIVEGLQEFGFSETNPLKAELVKLSHHGSKANTSRELLKMIDSDCFVISTNGDTSKHPNKQLLARLIDVKKNCKLYFNYGDRIANFFSEQDRIDYPDFQAIDIIKDLEF